MRLFKSKQWKNNVRLDSINSSKIILFILNQLTEKYRLINFNFNFIITKMKKIR